MAEAVRRYLAPVAVVGALVAIGYAAAQPHRSAVARDPFRAASPSRTPARSTTTSPYWTLPPPTTVAGNPQVAMDAVQWAEVAYPGSCGEESQTTVAPGTGGTGSSGTSTTSTGFAVDQVSFAQPDPANQVAVVLVQCGDGAVPVGLYVYEGAESVTEPTLIETLIPLSEDLYTGSFSISNTAVSVDVQSGSPDRTGSCCAGLTYSLSWTWSDGEFR